MRCSKCGRENRAGRRFCAHCGARLTLVCASCKAENEPGERFCGECGTALGEPAKSAASPDPRSTPPHLADRILAEQAAMEARAAADGERKTITALFADITGSVELMQNLDPEEARAVVDPALQLMMDAVHRYEGYVAQSRGDGIFALFGAPIAHEDHPQRAIHAALRMQGEIKRYAEKLRGEKGVTLEIRVGLNSGQVVVRSIRKDDLHTDYVPIGHSTNLAARLESLATPGSVVVSDATRKLTEGYFEFRSLGAARVKGVSELINIYEAVRAGPLRTKLEVSARRGLVRFIGRQSEMDELKRALDRAKAGHGQIVGVMGEPGVGKSRLFHEFKLVSRAGLLPLQALCLSHGKAYPYLPLIELLNNYFGILPEDDERKRREKIAGKALMLDRALDEALPYVFFLLGIGDPGTTLHQMDSEIRRQRTLEVIKRLFLRETGNQPLLIFIEDLHWVDNETQAFLAWLGESVAGARVMLLVNYRPEYEHPWGTKTYFKQLRLDPLEKESAEEMLEAMLGDEAGLSPLKKLILQETDGTPFFMEEIVQALFDRGVLVRNGGVSLTSPVTEIQVPQTVEGVLAARIDRLRADEKELLQTAAVVGREFSLELLQSVTGQSAEVLRATLVRLQAAEFVYEQPASAEQEYTFKHALTQDVAYASVLLERRRHLHERIAQTIEAIAANRLPGHYSELAHHYTRSGNAKKGVEYLRLAGEQAAQRSAPAEAVTHLTAALELLGTLPESQERARQELALRLAIGPPLMALKGYGAPELENTYRRAGELCRELGSTAELAPALFGLWAFHEIRAEYGRAFELGEQLLTLAERTGDPLLLPEAHWVLGDTLFFQGDLTRARDHFEQGIALYDRREHKTHVMRFGQDPGVCCLSFLAWVLLHLGFPDRARRRAQETIKLARDLGHPFSLARALCLIGMVHHMHRDPATTREQAEAALTLSLEEGLPWLGSATALRGWALVEQGHDGEGIAEIRQGLDVWRAGGWEIALPYSLTWLAGALARLRRPAEALSVVMEALAVAEKNGERHYEAGLFQLEGELQLALPERSEMAAEASFRRAIEIARRQSAKFRELRATTSLARLLDKQGRTDEARRMLGELYGWFTEGFDTADLKEAKALLDELSQ